MTQKELLYIEDMLSHEEYFIQHLVDIKENVQDEQMAKMLQKLIKKNKDLYEKFYNLF